LINWFNVFANSLWILGLSIAVTTFSYDTWYSYSKGKEKNTLPQHPDSQKIYFLAGGMICLGFALTSPGVIITIFWIGLSLLFYVLLGKQIFGKTKQIDSDGD